MNRETILRVSVELTLKIIESMKIQCFISFLRPFMPPVSITIVFFNLN